MVAINNSYCNGELNGEPETPAIVEIKNVSRRFGEKFALDDVSFRVPAGTVVGLVGENGAGKTTLIKHILGLLKAQTGTVRVFGLDPVADPVGVLSRIGYLSEEPDMPGWMRVRELMRYVAAFYPTWDHDYAERLRREFDLDPAAKVKQLSKGQRARAGLLIALAYRPELLAARRAIVRPRSDRAPRHFGRDHPHDRRRRPHRAVFVAPAGRSRARLRPGRHDQIGPHPVLRFARSDQADARTADAAIRATTVSAARSCRCADLGRLRLRMDRCLRRARQPTAIGRGGDRSKRC